MTTATRKDLRLRRMSAYQGLHADRGYGNSFSLDNSGVSHFQKPGDSGAHQSAENNWEVCTYVYLGPISNATVQLEYEGFWTRENATQCAKALEDHLVEGFGEEVEML